MLGIKEKIQDSKKDGDVITCNNIRIYVSKQKPKQFDGLLYALMKAFENLKIEFELNVIDSRDAFGYQLPILRLENRIIQRQSFLDTIRVIYLHSDDDNQGEEKNSRVSNFIDICQKLDQISTYFQYFDDETEYLYRDAYKWIVHPIKKLAYRWKMRVFSHFFEEKGLLNKSNVLNDTIIILNKLIEMFEQNKFKSFSQGSYHGKSSCGLDICDILITGIFSQIKLNLSQKCDLTKLIEQEKFMKIRDFCASFFEANQPKILNQLQQGGDDNNSCQYVLKQVGCFRSQHESEQSNVNVCLFYETSNHHEVQEAREAANQQPLSAKKIKKMMINNISINSISLLLMFVVLLKNAPRQAQQMTTQ
ncbi:transmembrane protein, putative (macronuclear) [Tetrahymena thermophila SB210]|uniref:Transmembrane protein, putative n=1 Tax=Tetrahymena thermophila (strain SB210) TaxID=312017 RepID=Q23D28_TETTS|nr:transmembrane protein, putative [Tetrahymena thermophila SB210]EAR94377.1 transmembrane protein, putative [Tetrahymena thermophila SB210]|eukprot:XP_001014858.1 transmembrane protein, putative [Tetrahymena thermophila SB210]